MSEMKESQVEEKSALKLQNDCEKIMSTLHYEMSINIVEHLSIHLLKIFQPL
ncbi:hypothetical protein AJ79_10346, partial [Helicocarpus griseus UAMH5409]